MKKVILDSIARFKLERLCDALHPQEVGGTLFGPQNTETIWIDDIFPIANVAEDKNHTFKEHSWGNYWRDLYAYANKRSWLGTFHSHPNGTIPSEQDMRAYNDSNLHLWIIHHSKGEHTFQASIGLNHVNLELAATPVSELLKPEMTDYGFRLGEIVINEHGNLQMDSISTKLLALDQKSRLTYFAIKKIENAYNDFSYDTLLKKLVLSRATLNKRLRALTKAKLVRHEYRDRWGVERT